MITFTSGGCFSACTLVFMAGSERLLGDQGRLGFHTAGLYASDAPPSMMMTYLYRKAFLEHGVSDTFLEKVLNTQHKDLWMPEPEELLREGIVTAQVNARSFEDGRLARLRQDGQLKVYLLGSRVFKTLARVAPEQYQKQESEVVEALAHFSTFADFHAAVKRRSDSLLSHYIGTAPAPELIEFWRAHMALLQALYEDAPEQCGSFMLGLSTSRFDYRTVLSVEALKRRQDAELALIEAAMLNPQGPGVDAAAELTAAFASAKSKAPDAEDMYLHPSDYADEPENLCSAFLALYRPLLAIPDEERAGSALRQLARLRGQELSFANVVSGREQTRINGPGSLEGGTYPGPLA
ncbi:hypothetical protein [Phytopseudomonas dryadis]|uniref:Uncharacterized protein n=1 Tax=Phytopseudomonas dryadis TaxID=2487520 RepID=A0A4Q9QRX0_9GAMM|nr:hypothetical protein [Pseudomonas dryadis]TBU82957.1 hypothetical protein DNK44_25850 [Pseudomonas dryadis]